MLKIGKSHTELPQHCPDLRAHFDREHALIFPDAIDPLFLDTLTNIANRGNFVHQKIPGIGQRSVETPATASNLIMLAMRRTNFLRWIEDIAQIQGANDVEGKLVETGKANNEQLNWHDDINKSERLLAFTINFSQKPYQGGEFQLRRKGHTDLLFQHRHHMYGSLMIFRISRHLEHQLTPITDGGPRRVFAGWILNRL